jgi:hypothetical protein
MRAASTWTNRTDPVAALDEAYDSVLGPLGGAPSWAVVWATDEHDVTRVGARFRERAGSAPLHGATSCGGLLVGDGYRSGPPALGLFALRDPEGAYGTAAVPLGGDARAAARAAVAAALDAARRPGETPAIVWLTAAPGDEEAVLRGVQDVLGPHVPVAGGSAADRDIGGRWRVFTAAAAHGDGVAVSVLFPSTEVLFGFQSGYEPTAHRGRVTAAEGRVLRAIDGRPALTVYDEWLDGALADLRGRSGALLERSSFAPLGRVAGAIGAIPYYCLSHPAACTPDGAISLFTAIEPGEEVVCMTGTADRLVERAGRVAAGVLDGHGATAADVAGALVVYCAGCMLAVRPRMAEVAKGLHAALGGAPLLGGFTFGEQGRLVGGGNGHGNLMISVLLFTAGQRP